MIYDAPLLLERHQPKEIKVVQNSVQFCAARFSPCGKFLIGGGYDSLLHRWDASTDEFRELPTIAGHGGWVQEIAFDPAGAWLYSADSWGQLHCSPYAEEQPRPKWTVADAHDGWIHALAISGDGKLLATCGSDRRVRVWSADDGRKLHEFAGHEADVLSIRFHPDGKSLVAGDLHGILKQWDLAAEASPRQFDAGALFKYDRLQDVGGVRSLAFSPDGAWLACGGTKPANGGNVQGIPAVLIFDWSTSELKYTLELGKPGDVYVCDLRFHPAGFLMTAISGNPGVGKLVYQRPEDQAPFFETTKMANCHSLSLHPNGSRLAVVATNGGSNGNGRQLDKNGEYAGNWSPIHILDMPSQAAPQPAT
jgi:dipeptidyl aminopeptidase/acylaminoacyl peptidase